MKSFLLGAGASIDAGLESSIGLTRTVAEHIRNRSLGNPVSQVLHAVIGAMVQHDTSGGGDAFLVPDIERVFSAVSDLKRRDDLDISAFVERWNSSFDMVTGPPGLRPRWAQEFREALTGEAGGDHELRAVFENGVNALTESTPTSLFADLEQQMRLAMVQVLKIDPKKVSYLEPMLSTADLSGIATLNYDISVESACARSGRTIDTGLDRWGGGYGWEWDQQADVRLLKLHGSLEYVLNVARPRSGRMPTEHLVNAGNEIGANPALVFGLGSKLRSDGPFLAMLVELDRMFSRTEWLTIVGYSFRDQHINAAITRWMNSDVANRLSIIDPGIDAWTQRNYGGPSYFVKLRRGASGEGYEFGKQRTWSPIRTDLISKGAAQGLAELHG